MQNVVFIIQIRINNVTQIIQMYKRSNSLYMIITHRKTAGVQLITYPASFLLDSDLSAIA